MLDQPLLLIIAGTIVLAAALLAAWLWTPDLPRGVLEPRYLEAAGDMLTVGDWTLHVRDRGPRDAPPIILLHGFGSSLHTWDAWAGQLAEHWRVVRYDQPGCGLSPPDPAADYSDARAQALLLTLLDALAIERAIVIGHSLGGRIAWAFAAAHPARIARLVLVAPDGFASPGFEYGKAPKVPAIMQLMRWVLPRALFRMTLLPAYAHPSTLDAALLSRYHDLLRAPDARAAMLDRMRQILLVDPLPQLRSIDTPTLLLWGEADRMIPFANAADFRDAIANARLVSIPRTGHVPQEESPGPSLEAVCEFLQPARQQ
jgi:pimeloyl-ACP methyl ester carboxylesterase